MNIHNGCDHQASLTMAMARAALTPSVRTLLARFGAARAVYWDVRALIDAGVPSGLAMALRSQETPVAVRARTDLDHARRVTLSRDVVWAPDIAAHLQGFA